MIKGINKNMIVVKNTGSRYFEEAHFIMKNSVSDVHERDLVREASRIVGSILTEGTKPKKPKKRAIKTVAALLLSFVSGAALGILLCLIS